MNKCEHKTAIVIEDLEKYDLTLLLCTWDCQAAFWMTYDNGVTKEIEQSDAMKIIENIEKVM